MPKYDSFLLHNCVIVNLCIRGSYITQMMGNMDTFNNTFLTLYKNYLTRHFELERNKNVAFTQYFEKRKIFYNN